MCALGITPPPLALFFLFMVLRPLNTVTLHTLHTYVSDYPQDSPGPGSYRAPSGLGRQLINGKVSANGPAIGKDAKGTDPNKPNPEERNSAQVRLQGGPLFPLFSSLHFCSPLWGR
jgi:hypothetical protein